MDCDDDLREQVIGYYEYIWVRRRAQVSFEDLYKHLPFTIRGELSMAAYQVILDKVCYSFVLCCIAHCITSNGGLVVTVVSMSATHWEALVRTGFESWWHCRWCTRPCLVSDCALLGD